MVEHSESEILQRRVIDAWTQALNFYRLKQPLPEIDLSLKGRAAGQARWRWKKGRFTRPVMDQLCIRLNLDAYRLDMQEMLEETIPHEVAHLITQILHGYKKIAPHGAEWRAVMSDCFGITQARRTHDLTLPRARKVSRRFLYRCQCDREHLLTSIRHNRIRRGTVYLCRQCGSPLSYCGTSAAK